MNLGPAFFVLIGESRNRKGFGLLLCVCDMDDIQNFLCGWSWEENKLFELALAVVDQEDPNRWAVVAALVGGKKSADDVQKQYVILLEDLHFIESGKLDHKLGEVQSCVQVDFPQSICCTDEDHNLLVQLDIN